MHDFLEDIRRGAETFEFLGGDARSTTTDLHAPRAAQDATTDPTPTADGTTDPTSKDEIARYDLGRRTVPPCFRAAGFSPLDIIRFSGGVPPWAGRFIHSILGRILCTQWARARETERRPGRVAARQACVHKCESAVTAHRTPCGKETPHQRNCVWYVAMDVLNASTSSACHHSQATGAFDDVVFEHCAC